ncbi:MAG: hypothetical protein GX639_09775 [Fibrobacter sp.]|nr:hypothetical protein [Fibrobacter sp.]
MSRGLLLFIALLILFGTSSAQDTFDVDGQGIGANQREALKAAKRDAIEKGIEKILHSQTERENFKAKRDLVLTKTIGAIKTYQILSQHTQDDGFLKLVIKVAISKQTLRDELAASKIVIESMSKPKVLIVINESNINNDDPGNTSAETAIIAALKDPYGFEIVDQKIVTTIKRNKQKIVSPESNVAEVASLGTRFGADVFITGTATSRRAEMSSENADGMIAVDADVTIKAINCITAHVIATASEHTEKAHISPQTAGTQAIAAAAKKCAETILDSLIKDWQNQTRIGVLITITVNTVATARIKNNVISTLKGIAGVTSVNERSWNTRNNTLSVDIQYKGNPNGLATKADGYKLSTGGRSLAVTGINGQEITLSVQAL